MVKIATFSLNNVQSQIGKIVIVTGGNAGIGFGIVKGLASKGATVILASRNLDRINEAIADIKKLLPQSNVIGMVLDVSSFSSIDKFVGAVNSQFGKVDVLINNAGLSSQPFAKTEQGFEATLGINIIGTAYLTNSLLSLISQSDDPRIVLLSSSAANFPTVKTFERSLLDVGGERLTDNSACQSTYEVSKLLDSMYAHDLQRRLESHTRMEYRKILVCACDPGLVNTAFVSKVDAGWRKAIFVVLFFLAAVPLETGALSSIYCATVPDIPDYMRGGTISAGPKVGPYKWTTKAYTSENCQRAFEAVNAAIVSKGFQGFLE